MEKVLVKIAKLLNEASITWGVGASLLLKKHGLVDKAGDIDLVIDENDIDHAIKIIEKIATKWDMNDIELFGNEFFGKYHVDGIDVDVMIGLSLQHESGVFKYPFDNNSISERSELDGELIPYSSLEDWYVIYQLLENREPKVLMIEKHLATVGTSRSHFEHLLKCDLPLFVRQRIDALLESVDKL